MYTRQISILLMFFLLIKFNGNVLGECYPEDVFITQRQDCAPLCRDVIRKNPPSCTPCASDGAFLKALAQNNEFPGWSPDLLHNIPWNGPALPGSDEAWSWQVLPQGLLFRPYYASEHESRLGIHVVRETQGKMNYWDPTIGARVGLIRYGTTSAGYPEGFQLDIEGAVIARLTLDTEGEVWGSDYRFAAPITYRNKNWEFQCGYYHISSHRGDELMIRQGNLERINYVRHSLIFGVAYRPDSNWRFYLGVDYAFYVDGGAEPWQLQVGFEYSPILAPNTMGSPFAACDMRLCEENNWSPNVVFELGWQWKSLYQHTLRTGLFLKTGFSNQCQFYDTREDQFGLGVWYDF